MEQHVNAAHAGVYYLRHESKQHIADLETNRYQQSRYK
jgi:hypothetical protein